MDETISALRTSVVDDVHLCLRIADLLEALTTKIRLRFIPFHPPKLLQSPTKQPLPFHLSYPPDFWSLPTTTATVIPPSPSPPNPPLCPAKTSTTPVASPPPGGTYLGAPDSNISVMPPPRSLYNNATFNFPLTRRNNNKPTAPPPPNLPIPSNTPTPISSPTPPPQPPPPPRVRT